ncbi:hypothetical protein I6N90_16070 [Paenibacillus sp. GSMTC-2017]|uniref:hypothetical protein n=1 Tax=Paenibacillus sp. GSMTC-2017 TaxID=2794350 RepID=UPI0018D82C0C|nr:hypothetical protein [Paenibacillus sp. GSMTC-2017]MBH5319317.1 hypothetical protein [Paenibacillus sp. GSMTC-2017]
MSEYKSEWVDIVKRGSLKESAFTEEMKRTILENVDRPRRRNRLNVTGFMSVAVMACLIIGLLFINGNNNEDSTKSMGSSGLGGNKATINEVTKPKEDVVTDVNGKKQYPIEYKVLKAKEWKRGDMGSNNDPFILPGIFNTFNPLLDPDESYMDGVPIKSVEIINQKKIEGIGVLVHYRYPGEEKTLVNKYGNNELVSYTGLVLGEATGDSVVYQGSYGPIDNEEISMTKVFGQSVIKTTWQCMAVKTTKCSMYIKNDDGELSYYLNFDLISKTYEQDLDGDGLEEVIVATVKGNQIYVFKKVNEKLEWAPMRETLRLTKDDVLVFSEVDNSFTVRSYGAQKSIKKYLYKQGSNKLVEA